MVFSANLSDPSMNVNINHLKKSTSLNQLIQLSAAEKEQLVENPSTVIIVPFFLLSGHFFHLNIVSVRIRLLKICSNWINYLRMELD